MPSFTASGSGTMTLPTRTTTGSQTLTASASLPTATRTATGTLTLPTGSYTATLPTASVTYTLPTETVTYTTSLPSESVTFTLPSKSMTATITIPSASSTETLTLSLPSSSESETYTWTLPTSTLTHHMTVTDPNTLTLPTASATASQSLPSQSESLTVSASITATVHLPTASRTQSYTIPSYTESTTFTLTPSDSFTLPSASRTMTLTLPTISTTRSVTLSLPTLTASSTHTLTLPTLSTTRTLTTSQTATLTMPSITESRSGTFTIPTETVSNSQTLTLPSRSSTQTLSSTSSASMSLPTQSISESITLTLPSTTKSVTLSQTETDSVSESVTLSETLSETDTISTSVTTTASMTITPTLTLPAHNNFSTTLEPGEFMEGQELRIRLRALLQCPEYTPRGECPLQFEHFNVSDGFGDLEVKVWDWVDVSDYNCKKYEADTRAPYYYTKQYGMTIAEQLDGLIYVGAAHVTIAAPHHSREWVICFRHTPTGFASSAIQFEHSGEWVLFTRRGYFAGTRPESRQDWVFQSSPTILWYYLPDPRIGQYTILQLNSLDPTWNFTYPSYKCSASAPEHCLDGDNIKIVPQGFPCTYENSYYGGDLYYGSGLVSSDGSWMYSARNTVRVGALAGGVGLFGTQRDHPAIDPGGPLSVSGSYEQLLDANPLVESTSRAYVFLRLPRREGGYDICYSSKDLRARWTNANNFNGTISSLPMWMKLYPCGKADCNEGLATAKTPTLQLGGEDVGWTMVDASPGTYGTIRIDAGRSAGLARGGLSRAPMRSPEEYRLTRNYWNVSGGDQLRLVPAAQLSEKYEMRPSPQDDRPYGSNPMAGCWYRDNDRVWDEGTDMPTAVRDFTADPTIPGSEADGDLTDVHDVYGTVYVPGVQQVWHVCYRQGGVSPWRVLPWHDSRHGVPRKWQFLERTYSPAATWYGAPDWGPFINGHYESWGTRAGTPLVPGSYEPPGSLPVPQVRYRMNDTRRGTWGPVVVFNDSAVTDGLGGLSTLPWNFVRNYADGERVADTQGSALRLVQPSRSCDYPGFVGDGEMGSESLDGGGLECNNAHAGSDCAGSSLDAKTLQASVAYYVTVPRCSNTADAPAQAYTGDCAPPNECNLCSQPGPGLHSRCLCLWKVCWRQGGYNWRVLEPESAMVDVSFLWAHVRLNHWLPHEILFENQTERRWTLDQNPPGFASYYSGLNTALHLLRVDPEPSVRLSVLEQREGLEALFIISDSSAELAVSGRGLCSRNIRENPLGQQCHSSGDVFRLVPSAESCDIYPFQWTDQRLSVLADTHLSLFCPVPGAGSAAVSGLGSARPCNANPVAKAGFCGGQNCDATGADVNLLTMLLAKRSNPSHPGVVDIYDDLVPFNAVHWGASTVAASILLPAASQDPAQNVYKQCYKQADSPNWIIFNMTFEIAPVQRPVVVNPQPTFDLLAGEFQRFQLTEHPRPDSIALFHAKLVAFTGDDNDGCINPPGSTEAHPYASSTGEHQVLPGGTIIFFLIVPHRPGPYWLCVRTEESARDMASWHRWGTYTVHDPGARWYVRQGSQPTNQGLSVVLLMRCTWDPQAETCGGDTASEAWNTDPAGDAFKLVPWRHPCHGGDPAIAPERYGDSAHVGLEGGGVGGITDLGPADGPADVAEAATTLPPGPADRPVEYKVCVWGQWDTVGRRTWVELPEAAGVAGQYERTVNGAPAHFTSQPAFIQHWSISPELLSGSALGLPGVVTMSGAMTTFIESVSLAEPRVTAGLLLSTFPGPVPSAAVSASDRFKLVRVRSPRTRQPPPPANGAGWAWEDPVEYANCLSPAEGGSAVPDAQCSDPDLQDAVHCPKLTVQNNPRGFAEVAVHLQLPQSPGYFHVCYQRAGPGVSPQPWLWLGDVSGELGLYTVPTYLEFDAAQASLASPQTDQARLYDTRAFAGQQLSSWCGAGGGIPCQSLNPWPELRSDWVAVVNATMTCPVTRTPATTRWALGGKYHEVLRENGLTALPTGGLTLPPVVASPSGRYKICLLKVAHHPSAQAIARRGVVYSLWNRAVPEVGSLGQSGFFKPSEATSVNGLVIYPRLTYNSSVHFVVANESTAGIYGGVSPAALREASGGEVSNTPVISSGGYIDVEVHAASAGSPLPFGSFAVQLQHCPNALTWADVLCESAAVETTAPLFTVHNVLAACNGSVGPSFGWGDAGLQQFLTSGKVIYRIQYRSRCPVGTGEVRAGCGLRFAAVNSEGTAIYSPPLWLNVREELPDAVAIDLDPSGAPQRISTGQWGLPLDHNACARTGPPRCYLKRCRSGRVCSVSLAALRRGPRLFAAAGTVSLMYSLHDYGSLANAVNRLQAAFVDGIIQFVNKDWEAEGAYVASFTPVLQGSVSEGYIFFNVSYGGGCCWTRMVIHVERIRASRLMIRDIVPLDTGDQGVSRTGDRTPVPVWSMRSDQLPGLGPADIPPSLVAEPGSYLEALAPYELRFQVEGSFDGEPVVLSSTNDLDGWLARTAIDGVSDETLNAVLEVERALCEAPPCPPDPVKNFLTATPYATVRADSAPEVADGAAAGLWRMWFRMRSSRGCSRFEGAGTAPGGVGCRIRLTLLLESLDLALVAFVTTPVRSVADTIRVIADAAVGPMRGGVAVLALPGVVVGSGADEVFAVDEFHYGTIFALLSSPGPLQSGGAATRDGVSLQSGRGAAPCAAHTHDTLGPVWGAQWTLRTDRPCRRCKVTFHSTWGASASSMPSTEGELELTLSDDAVGIGCAADGVALYSADAPGTDPFDVIVTAIDADGGAVGWPRWWVFTDQNSDVVVGGQRVLGVSLLPGPEGVSSGGVMTQRMAEGAAVFGGVSLGRSNASVAFPRTLQLRFEAIGEVYDPAGEGTLVTGTTKHNCSATVSVEPRTTSTGVSVRVLAAEAVGGSNLCGIAEPNGTSWCDKWMVSTDDATLSLPVQIFSGSGAAAVPDAAVREITVRVSQTLLLDVGNNPWNCTPAFGIPFAQSCSAGPFNLLPGAAHGAVVGPNHTYTYGGVNVTFRRDSDGAGQSTGAAVIHVRMPSPAPVRAASFELCAIVPGGAAGQQLDPSVNCTTVSLWVVAPPRVVRRVAVLDHDLARPAPMAAGTAQCGAPDPRRVRAIGYYEFPQFSGRLHIEYGASLVFTLRSSSRAHILADATNDTRTGNSIAARGALAPGLPLWERLTSAAAAEVEILFYSMTGSGGAVELEVQGQNDDVTGPDSAFVSAYVAGYSWEYPSEPARSFSILPEPFGDDECSPKRALPQSLSGYRVFRPLPGVGWRYEGTADYAGVSVGVPFPLQARVLSRGLDDTARAWAYPSTLVMVTKSGATQCNDGGELTLYELRPTSDLVSGRVALDGRLGTSFTRLSAGKLTSLGQATIWPTLSQPCGACTLQVMLCYAAAARSPDPSSCLQGDVGDEATSPIFSERTQITKPFSVTKVRASELQVVSQALPALRSAQPGGRPVAEVGSGFSVGLQPVQAHGPWTLAVDAANADPARVVAYSAFMGGAEALDSAQMRYGNGGFLSKGQAVAVCDVSPEEFSAASVDRWSTATSFSGSDLLSGPWTLAFFFTRPCSACGVRLRYAAAEAGGGVQARDFAMLDYNGEPGAPVLLAVRTCGLAWVVAGVPLAAVRRRAHFSVTVWRADFNRLPAWADDAEAQVLRAGGGGGNGGGGELAVSSPALQDSPPTVRSDGGVAVVRISFSRACYQCRLTVAGKPVAVAVISDPAKVVAVPLSGSSPYHVFDSPGKQATFTFDIYAADEFGDRAYSVGGPTVLAWMPRWRQEVNQGAGVVLRGVSQQAVSTFDDRGEPVRIVRSGVDQFVAISNGSIAYNGVPFGALAHPESEYTGPGVVVVKVRSPVAAVPLEFEFGGTSGLPTTVLGAHTPPRVSLTVSPQRFLVDVSTATPRALSVGEVLPIRAFAVGRPPGQTAEGNPWYVSSAPLTRVAKVSVDCRSIAVPEPRCLSCAFSFAVSADAVADGSTLWMEVETGSAIPVTAAPSVANVSVSNDTTAPSAGGPANTTAPPTLGAPNASQGGNGTAQTGAPSASPTDNSTQAPVASTQPPTSNQTESPTTLASVEGQPVSFQDGVARFLLRADSSALAGTETEYCTVSVTVGGSLLPVLTLAVSPLAGLTEWRWSEIPGELAIAGDPFADVVLSASAVMGRPHRLRLQLWSADFAPASRFNFGAVFDPLQLQVTVAPVVLVEGGGENPCWVQSADPVTNPPLYNEVILTGRFVMEGTCTMDSVQGFAEGQSLGQRLAVAVAPAGTVVLAQARVALTGEPANFSGLDGRTADGHLAAFAGVPVGLTFHALTPSGELDVGEYQAVVLVTAARLNDTVTLLANATGGIATVTFVPPSTTRWAGVHVPWSFAAVATDVSDPQAPTPLAAITGINPLYAVTRAVRLSVQMVTYSGLTLPVPTTVRDCALHPPAQCPQGAPSPNAGGPAAAWDARAASGPEALPAPYVSGWPLALRLSLADYRGDRPEAEEDPGYTAVIHFRPVEVPCANVERAELADGRERAGCVVGGRCEYAELAPCTATDWRFGAASSSVATFRLEAGPPTWPPGEVAIGLRNGALDPVLPVRYVGARGDPARFTFTASGIDGTREVVWLSEIAFQRTSGLELVGSGVDCTVHSDAHRCSLPAEFRDEASAWPTARRLSPLTEFDISVRVVDGGGRTVVGDGQSFVRIVASCPSQQALDAPFSLGRLTGFTGRQFLRGDVEGRVTHGVVNFTKLAFPFSCTEATIESHLLPLPTSIDYLQLNAGAKGVISRPFRVSAEPGDDVEAPSTPVPTPVPEPAPFREFPTAVLQLRFGLDLLAFVPGPLETAVLEDVQSAVSSATAVVVELLCNIPNDRVRRRPPIFEADRRNPNVCKRFKDAAQPAERTAEALQDDLHAGPDACPCSPLAELRVEHSAPRTDTDVQLAIVGALARIPGSNSSRAAQEFGIPEGGFSLISTGPPKPPPPPTSVPGTPAPPQQGHTPAPLTPEPLPLTPLQAHEGVPEAVPLDDGGGFLAPAARARAGLLALAAAAAAALCG